MRDIYVGQLVSSNYLEHHGILGMKWGVRRFQNKDGTLTPAGKKRYYKTDEYGVSEKDISIGKKYRSLINKYSYKNPIASKKEDVESILRYDRTRDGEGQRYFNGPNGVQLIYHYKDNNGKIALSYSRVPGHGDVYVPGPGNIDDLKMERLFRKPPKNLKIKR